MKRPDGKTLYAYSGALILGTLFLLLFSVAASPLHEGARIGDSSLYTVLGRAVNAGHVMYRDMADVKGPLFFFWEALGQKLMDGKGGIFLLELFCMWISCVYLVRICFLRGLKAWGSITVFSLFFLIYAAFFWGGNTAEEFILPLNLICIFHYLKYSPGEKLNFFAPLFYGITLGVCLFSKATLGMNVCALTLATVIAMVRKKEIKTLGFCALFFLAGLTAASLAAILPFAAKGALGDMLLWTFSLAFKRGVGYIAGFSMWMELRLILPLAGIALFILMRGGKARGCAQAGMEDDKADEGSRECSHHLLLPILIMSVLDWILLRLGTPFDYYFLTLLPLTLLMSLELTCLLGELSEEEAAARVRRRILRGAAAILAGLGLTLGGILPWLLQTVENDFREIAGEKSNLEAVYREVYGLIPAGEVPYSLQSGMIFYDVNDLIPDQKYLDGMESFAGIYPAVQDEVMADLEEKQPGYIITVSLEAFTLENVREKVLSSYEMVIEIPDMVQLWRRKP